MMYTHYMKTAKEFMADKEWKLAMFYLGKAEATATHSFENDAELIEKIIEIEYLVHMCHREESPA